ncbi:iron complex transport system ATP-binding protein [Rhodosporidium toruloides NP11] [Rhodotorula toruloides]|uniref:BY PROTMAP: gi/472581008/gb/EMS18769.1/ iron complex transport system ATP-binding protein [Rhodosporidium toruloides NP11] n=1 Tax=Rhodotorula toruloides TaxID=5286 RepID=A0A0K3CJI3_RHOTO|nr:iron complex transport system ATP-binding protein [Rhodosporidium toruloides NP11] [Rhodotorula toruloides]PRQ72373.1 P-loop containing nucleoside triphosphate hydrolase protein [Rhodotorula toruloides]
MVVRKARGEKASPSAIHCSSQQSRFHTETLDTSREIDLKDVSISIGERELVSGAHLRLKDGVKYALVGRNGTGKSTVLTALADKLIPGVNPNLRILLLSQVEDSTRSSEDETRTVLQHVVHGDKERTRNVKRLEALTKAVDSTQPIETERIVRSLELEDRQEELVQAQLIAKRRSGTRGKAAREAEIQATKRVEEAELRLADVDSNGPSPDVLAQATDMLNDVQATLELLDSATTEARAATILTGLGFTEEMLNGRYSALSGGWRSRCSLATSLLVQSDVLLLDECTNFLDLEATIWLEHFLRDETRTLVIVSHDQAFLTAVVEETIILRNQAFTYFEGTPAAYEVEERKKAKRMTTQKEALDKKREHVEKSIQRGIASAKKTGDENRQRMVKSRQKKLDERWGLEQSAAGHRFKLNRDLVGYHLTRRAEVETQEQEAASKVRVPSPEKLRTLGDLVHFDQVEYRFPGAKTPLLANVTFTVEQGGRVAFVGANGNGKSTLAKLIVGEFVPTKGKLVRHPQLRIGYFSQHSVENLTLKTTSAQGGPVTALSHFLEHFEAEGEKVLESEARACLGSFGLKGEIASDTPLSQLSGGQKVRLALALIVFRPPPLLLLDEVTTHLDFSTIKALSKALKSFSGGIVLITHDRWFSRVVVEGETFQAASGIEDEEEEEAESSDSEEEGAAKRGQTFRVGRGGIKLMEKGMAGYVASVERKLAKRRG